MILAPLTFGRRWRWFEYLLSFCQLLTDWAVTADAVAAQLHWLSL